MREKPRAPDSVGQKTDVLWTPFYLGVRGFPASLYRSIVSIVTCCFVFCKTLRATALELSIDRMHSSGLQYVCVARVRRAD